MLYSQFKDFVQLHKKDIISLSVISVFLLFGSLVEINLPGLYLDAVNPDYIASRYLYRGDINNSWWVLPFIGVPLLGNIYHGTFTFFVSFVMGSMFGANIVTLRITNALYGLLGVIFVYFIVKLITKKTSYAFGASVVLATSAMLLASFRTQFYILLPGAVFTLIAIYCLISQQNISIKKTLLSGVFMGFAFYTYFVYIFFLPACILAIFLINKKDALSVLLKWFVGYILGASLYFIGYFGVFLQITGNLGATKNYIFISFIVLFIGFFATIFYYNYNSKIVPKLLKKSLYIFAFLAAVGVLLFLVFLHMKGLTAPILGYITSAADSLNITGKNLSFIERILRLNSHFKNSLGNTANELLIFGRKTSIFSNLYYLFFIISSLFAFIMIKFKKQSIFNLKSFFMPYIFLVSFFVTAIPFASRLGAHHFVIINFLAMLITALNVFVIVSLLPKNVSESKIIISKFAVTIFLFCMLHNISNNSLFFEELRYSGGRNYCTEQINILANDAVNRVKSGANEVYIFPEWGFMAGFSYLTHNKISYRDRISPENLDQFIKEGKSIILCYWSGSEKAEYYKGLFNNSGIPVTEKFWRTRDGQIAFYSLETD